MYKEYAPIPILSAYIDAYWISNTSICDYAFVQRILPDTCTDIIYNLGADLHAQSYEKTVLKADSCYLLGTMTRFSDVNVHPGTDVFGIRFKPFGLRALLGFSLNGTADHRQELSANDFDFRKFIIPITNLPDIDALNKFFYDRLPKERPQGIEMMNSIKTHGGKLAITELAALHHITERTVERIFREHTGANAKELCNQVRLRHAIRAIKQNRSDSNLLKIALDNGFYDHAHLSHNIRKYTGYAPSHFKN